MTSDNKLGAASQNFAETPAHNRDVLGVETPGVDRKDTVDEPRFDRRIPLSKSALHVLGCEFHAHSPFRKALRDVMAQPPVARGE